MTFIAKHKTQNTNSINNPDPNLGVCVALVVGGSVVIRGCGCGNGGSDAHTRTHAHACTQTQTKTQTHTPTHTRASSSVEGCRLDSF